MAFCSFSQANPNLSPNIWTDITPAGSNPNSTNGFYTVNIDSHNPGTVYACQANVDIWKTTNGGGNWQRLGTGTVNSSGVTTSMVDNPYFVFIDPANSQHLFTCHAAWGGTFSNIGLWESQDGGAHWTIPVGFQNASAQPGASADVGRFEIDPADFKHMLVSFRYTPGTDPYGYLESTDGAATFVLHAPPFSWASNSHGLHFLHNDGDPSGAQRSHTWLITTEAPGFWRTDNSGASYVEDPAPTGIHGGTENIYYARDGKLYSGGSPRLYRSTNNGLNWQELDNAGYGYFHGVYSDSQYMYIQADMGAPVMRSLETDGVTWTAMTSQPGGQRGGLGMFDFDKTNGILYHCTYDGGVWACKTQGPTMVTSPVKHAAATARRDMIRFSNDCLLVSTAASTKAAGHLFDVGGRLAVRSK
jgi:hypothetical protein